MTYDIIVLETADKEIVDKIGEILFAAHANGEIKDYSWRRHTPDVNIEDFISGLTIGITMLNLHPKPKT